MNKDLFRSGMRTMGGVGNGLAAMGGGTPVYGDAGDTPDVPGASNAPLGGIIGRGLGGIIKKFKAPEAKIPQPIGATDPGSMVQHPRGMLSNL